MRKNLVLTLTLMLCLLAAFAAPAAYAESIPNNTSNVVLYTADDLGLGIGGRPIGFICARIQLDKTLADRILFDYVTLDLPMYADTHGDLYVQLPNKLGGGGEGLGLTPYVIAYGSYSDAAHRYLKLSDLRITNRYVATVPVTAHIAAATFETK
ncbi:MAG: hypothetical protein ACPLTR_10415 [Thermacetogeniaceae bacterium]